MKKNLIVALALVFVLGIAGTAFAAANPFVDVPAKHWAYDAVSKLAKAGILDGYGDGTYRGERLASRYEMAQATAKAMARADKADAQMKALIDKLAVEFAAELNNLGVRVAKLEKNASSIKFNGDSRLFYKSNPTSIADTNGNTAVGEWNQRVRIYAKADVNDKVSFIGRWMAAFDSLTQADGRSSTDFYWDYAYFQFNFGPAFKLNVGRQGIGSGTAGLFNANGGYDAVTAQFGGPSDKLYGKIGYGELAGYSQAYKLNDDKDKVVNTTQAKPIFLADLYYKFNKDVVGNFSVYYGTDADKAALTTKSSKLTGAYTNGYPFQVYNFGVAANLNEDWKFKGSYFWNAATKVSDAFTNDAHNGWMGTLQYKGADAAKVGSWGAYVTYRDIKPFAIDMFQVSGQLGNSLASNNNDNLYGQKGWGLQADYTISKNAILTATYEALNRNSNADSTKLLPFYYVQLNITF